MKNVVVVGAGPAGASIAYLLANRGIDVTLVERRRDFAREFRGEILMPSGIEALQQMGLGEALAQTDSHAAPDIALYMNGKLILTENLDPEVFHGHPPLAISQPALLEAIVAEAEKLPRFKFERGVSVKELVEDSGAVTGVTIRGDDRERFLPADLVIGSDGRNSVVRKHLGHGVTKKSPPMDIVWCKLPCPDDWPGLKAYVGRGHLLVAYHTWDHCLQLGWVILKGTFGELRSKGIEAWIEEMARHVSPDLAAHLRAHSDAAQKPFLLDAVSDCVDSWSGPGVLLIGDAAHTMSPVGGQGVNIALRDAVVAANYLVPILNNSSTSVTEMTSALQGIEKERRIEVDYIQNLQAKPPKIVLSRAWWGEPVRRIAGFALGTRRIRRKAAYRVSAFPFGVRDVKLEV
jgi:2-polyprenyl-6-methoxyphenol hydroxylase-like FAD-dependent oxidoreductase